MRIVFVSIYEVLPLLLLLGTETVRCCLDHNIEPVSPTFRSDYREIILFSND